MNLIIDEELHVQSSNVEIGAALTEHCRQKMLRMGSKYFGKITSANAHFRHEGQAFAASVRFKPGGLKDYAAESVHRDPYRAFNDACEKVAKQLRRTKRMLREDKAHRPERDPRMIGRSFVSQQNVRDLLIPIDDDSSVHVLHPDASGFEAEMTRNRPLAAE